MRVSERIRVCREQDGLTQRELAVRVGVTVRTVSAWETGTRHPGPRSRAVLGEMFERPAVYFKEFA